MISISDTIFQCIQLKWLNNIYSWPPVKQDLKILGLLGYGGFGAVELVEHSKDQSTYALKAGVGVSIGDPKRCSNMDSGWDPISFFVWFFEYCWCMLMLLSNVVQKNALGVGNGSSPEFWVPCLWWSNLYTCPFANQEALSKGFVVKSGMQKSVMSVPTQKMWKIVGNWDEPTNQNGSNGDLYYYHYYHYY